jgi:predicted dehydrogenase
MNPIKIAFIGAGAIGGRYLQAFPLCKYALDIHIVEPIFANLERGLSWMNSTSKSPASDIKITTYSTVEELEDNFDITIIATTADVRALLLKSFLKKNQTNNLVLEKVVFQKEVDFKEIAKLLDKENIKTWVNCARRYSALYKELSEIEESKIWHCSLNGTGWGLACNSIHFIDLVQFLTKSKVSQVFTHGLTHIEVAKRPGFFELFGTLEVQFANGSSLSLKCNEGEPFLYLNITNDSNHFQISELTQEAWKYDSKVKGLVTVPHPLVNQSQLSHRMIEDIWETGNCVLPSYTESMEAHLKVLSAFNEFFENQGLKIDDKSCPIT